MKGVPHPLGFGLSKGAGVDLAFYFCSPMPTIAIQPSFSTIPCKTLNILIKVCYSLPCLLTLILQVSTSVNYGNSGRRWLARVLLPSIRSNRSKPFPFKRLRTHPRDGHHPSLSLSITCALFLPRRRGLPHLPILETRRPSLITPTCPQPLSLHALAHSFAESCTILHSEKTQLFSFHVIPHSYAKKNGGGGSERGTNGGT